MTTTPALMSLFANILAGSSGLSSFNLYTITLFNGTVLRFTDGDFDILAQINMGGSSPLGPFLFSSGGIGVDQKESKTQAHWKLGTDTDTWTVVLLPRAIDLVTGATFPDKIGGVPWIQAASAGALDAADFQVDRAYFSSTPTWPIPPTGAVPVGTKTIFAGQVAEVDTTDTTATLVVNDYRSLFTLQMPRRNFQAPCRFTLYGAGCNAAGNMNQSAFAVAGSCANGTTRQNVIGPGLRPPAGSSGTFVLGQIIFTSGLNNTFFSMVKTWDGLNFGLFYPLPFTPSPGDTFNVYPGCDKSLTQCAGFNNSPRYGGFPFIPAPETVA